MDAHTVSPQAMSLATDLARGCIDVLPTVDALAQRLELARAEARPLRIKLGMDPTSPDIHLGHAVVLQRLRQFQDAGHQVVLIIGDYTALVGDPTGRSKSRPVVDAAAIEAHAATYQEQAFEIIDPVRTEVRRNSEWLAHMTPLELFSLQRHVTVAQVLERDDFATRLRAQAPISLLELMYPLLQGYDSVIVDADVEFGGTDQLLNNLMGRTLMPIYGKRPQLVMTLPILTGLDGSDKMSKSLGNYIGVRTPPAEAFGRTMSIPDALMPEWFRLASGWSWSEAEERIRAVEEGQLHPNEAKRALARAVVARFHGDEAAHHAEDRFDAAFRRHEVPSDTPEVSVDALSRNDAGHVFLPEVLVAHLGMASRAEGRRMIAQGGVRLNGSVVGDDRLEWSVDELRGAVLQVGKRRFLRITP